jgi:hypothetical protein
MLSGLLDISKYQNRLDRNGTNDLKSIGSLQILINNGVLRVWNQTIRMVVVIEREVVSVKTGKRFVFSLEKSEGENG